MRRTVPLTALLLFAFAVPLFAQVQYSITPNRGPVGGGTEVTIQGQFGTWPYGVIFGDVSVPAMRVNETTLRATTPAHLPGTVDVTIFEYDMGIPTGLKFTFEGDPQEAYEPMLLPIFMPGIPGAYGSLFRVDFRARLQKETQADIHGLAFPCRVTCINLAPVITLTTGAPATHPDDVEYTGDPGAFLYLPKEQAGRVAMNLRAYDTSLSDENFGTELPIVRVREFAKGGDPITLIGVPADPRYRNTLRIYSYGFTSTPVAVTIQGDNGLFLEQVVELPGQPDVFHPGYVQLTNFPAGTGTLRVTITPIIPPISAPIPPPDRWAFISVTNNTTQHITLVTPQP
jgi:hypothetical protein